MKQSSIFARALARLRGERNTQSIPGGYGYGYGYGYGAGNLTGGGIANAASGLGGAADKTEASFYLPTRYHSRHDLEVMYAQSWACRKFIDIPIDDMFVRWREWSSDAGDDGEMMADVERRFSVPEKLARAMKAGRLYGTAVLLLALRDDDWTQPFDPAAMEPGRLIALHVFDRYALSVERRQIDYMEADFGMPLEYRFAPKNGPGFLAHASRVLRFDGIVSLTSEGHHQYDEDWGISDVVPAVVAITQDQATASAVGHLAQEASIPVVKIGGLRETTAYGRADPDSPSAEQIGEQINNLKSVFRTLFMDSGEEFERVGVTFAGLGEVMDRYATRLAACADIPVTRFWGKSPVGMNATGESDMANYAMQVAARQRKMLTEPLRVLDMLLAAEAGVAEPPEYAWPSLIDLSDADQAATAKAKVEALAAGIQAGVLDEDEAREALSGDPVFGQLPGDAPEPPEPELPPAPMPPAAPAADDGEAG